MKKITLLFISLLMISCVGAPEKVKSFKRYDTPDGFSFKLAMEGEWFIKKAQAGKYMVEKKEGKGKATFALVQHGPIWSPDGQELSRSVILSTYKKQLEDQAQSQRLKDVKNHFQAKAYKGASCLFFLQSGFDSFNQQSMNYRGLVCLHPKDAHKSILMGISHRSKLQNFENTSEAFNQLINSLRFL